MQAVRQQQVSWWKRLMRQFAPAPKTKDDLIADIKQALNQHIIDQDAWRMLQGVLSLSAMRVRDVMVPRAQMVMLSVSDSLELMLQSILETQHSRYPVTGEDKESLVGVLMSKDLLIAYMRNQQVRQEDLATLYRPVFYVPEGKRATELLREFQSRRLHMAVVVDEYGSLVGLVTIEDIIEAIVGEIDDEYDEADVHILQMNAQTFTVKAVSDVREVNQYFNTQLDTDVADTIGGLLVARFGRVPQTGESMQLEDLLFKVIRADRRRVYLLKVSRVDTTDAQHADATT